MKTTQLIDCRDCLNCKTQHKKVYCKKDYWVNDEGKSKTYADCYIFNQTTDEMRSNLCRGCEDFEYMGKRVNLKPRELIELNRNNSIISMLRGGKTPEEIREKHNIGFRTISRIKSQAGHSG